MAITYNTYDEYNSCIKHYNGSGVLDYNPDSSAWGPLSSYGTVYNGVLYPRVIYNNADYVHKRTANEIQMERLSFTLRYYVSTPGIEYDANFLDSYAGHRYVVWNPIFSNAYASVTLSIDNSTFHNYFSVASLSVTTDIEVWEKDWGYNFGSIQENSRDYENDGMSFTFTSSSPYVSTGGTGVSVWFSDTTIHRFPQARWMESAGDDYRWFNRRKAVRVAPASSSATVTITLVLNATGEAITLSGTASNYNFDLGMKRVYGVSASSYNQELNNGVDRQMNWCGWGDFPSPGIQNNSLTIGATQYNDGYYQDNYPSSYLMAKFPPLTVMPSFPEVSRYWYSYIY